MNIAVIGETAPPAKGGGAKASESQAGTGDFDLAMAAVMALLVPNTGESQPVRGKTDGESVISEGTSLSSARNTVIMDTGNSLQQQVLLTGAPAIEALDAGGAQAQSAAAEKLELPPEETAPAEGIELTPQQTASAGKKTMPAQSAEPVLKMAAEPAPENPDLIQKVPVPVSSTKGLEPTEKSDKLVLLAKTEEAGASPGKIENVLKAAGQNDDAAAKGDPASRAAPSGLTGKVEKNAPEKAASVTFTSEASAQATAPNSDAAAKGDPASRAAPSGLTGNTEKSVPEKIASVTFITEVNAQAASVKVNAAGTGQGRGTVEAERAEGKADPMLSGKIESGGTSPAGETKSESGGSNNSTGNTFQPEPAQVNAAGTLTGADRNLKGVPLGDLKDVVAQEIKHYYETRRGEQTQIQIKLEPENLGKLTIKLTYSNGELNAQFYTGSDHVKEILESSIGQLRESLSRQELTLNQAFVFVGNENRGSAGSQMEFGGRQSEFSPGRDTSRNNVKPNMEPDDYYRTGNDYPGVNYLI